MLLGKCHCRQKIPQTIMKNTPISYCQHYVILGCKIKSCQMLRLTV